jgi:dimethyladenosine transferase 1
MSEKLKKVIKLPALPSIRDILKLYNLRASKNLSQNFLLDQKVTDKFMKKIPNVSKKTCLEVGPGPGCLTRSILTYAKQCIAVEKDDRFLPALQMLGQAANGRFQLVQGDILEVNEVDILGRFKIKSRKWDEESRVAFVGNLPFGIATPLYIKWLRQISKHEGAFGEYGRIEMVLMFQKEVGERILAAPSTPEYGRLSIVSQNYCETRKLSIVKGKTFVPPPKVDGIMVHVIPRVKPLVDVDIDVVESFCKIIFGKRRKALETTFKTSLEFQGSEYKKWIPPEILNKRAQELTVTQICELAKLWKSNL